MSKGKTYVIVYEQFFENSVPIDAVGESLENLRQYGGARVIDSYKFDGGPYDEENKEWANSFKDVIEIPVGIE